MPVSTDVKLPKSHPPIFPDRCVACRAKSPGSIYRAGTNAIGWWTWVFMAFGRRHTVEVPACKPCRGQMGRQRWLQLSVNVVVIAVGVVLAGSLLEWYQGPFKRWLTLGVVLVCLLPVFLWEIFFPRPFDMTAFSDEVDYEFRDADYAAEFATLNQPPAEE
ncbi:MAG: hypothetical protein K8U57_04485 [Planctomycetes bacterium]|nr:hypothetical protein [Planctomycetota bacterium]